MRKFFYTVFIFSLTCTFCCFWGCAQKKTTISVFIYNEVDPFIMEFVEYITLEAESFFNTEFFYASNSQTIQNDQITQALANKNSIMVINPVDRLSAHAIVHKCKQEKKPVIFFNREPLRQDLDLWDSVWYVGARPEESGQLQVQVIKELFGGNPNKLNELDKNKDGIIQTIILKGEQGHQDAETRTNEVLKCFEQSGWKIEVLLIESANWNYDEAYSKIGPILEEYGDRLELIISNNDDMALGSITKMRQIGYFKDTNEDGKIDMQDASWLPIVGIDGLKEAKESIEQGYLYGTVRNDSLYMSRAIIELCSAIVGDRDFSHLTIPITDEKYLWIAYQPFVAR